MITRSTIPVAIAVAFTFACDGSTSRLSEDQEKQFAAEGVLHRAADLEFRYTRDPGGRGQRWEYRRASIVVTRASLLIHKNDKVGLRITPMTRRAIAIERSGERVRIRTGTGRSEEIWSFVPPDDAAAWTQDIRAITKPGGPGSRR